MRSLFESVDHRIISEPQDTASKLHSNGPGVSVPLVSIVFIPHARPITIDGILTT